VTALASRTDLPVDLVAMRAHVGPRVGEIFGLQGGVGLEQRRFGRAKPPGLLQEPDGDKQGVITRDVLTKQWTDWVDYWAVDFNDESRQEIIKVPKGAGINTVQGHLPGQEPAQRELALPATEFEDRWTGAYIFENEWQSFRTRQNRDLDLTSATHIYEQPGRYVVAVKVIDIFGNDTMTLVRLNVG
jgi:site-specific DNA-methyltransferase (adenine-specific)/adenine-specific DNA-methyltransferase